MKSSWFWFNNQATLVLLKMDMWCLKIHFTSKLVFEYIPNPSNADALGLWVGLLKKTQESTFSQT